MKFDFGDLYKFTVSLGVVLITLAILAPWLFLKEPFDLFKTEIEIKALSVIAQSAIAKRQATVSFILEFIPWFSTICSLVGSCFIYIGLKKWLRNQLHIDEQTRLDVEIKKQSLRDATKDEIEEKEALEYSEQQVPDDLNVQTIQIKSPGRRYSEIEKLVYDKLASVYKSKYKVSHNQMVGEVELDILLQGKTMLAKDYIVEVKYIRKGFNFGWLRQAFLKNIYAKSVYSQLTNKSPNTLLLVVINSEAYDEGKYNRLMEKIREESIGRKGKDLVRIIIEQNIKSLKDNELQEKLGIYI